MGFDIEMVQELGRRLDLPVTIIDFPAGSLLDALRLGQADLALVGITAVESTQGIEFTAPYMLSRDVLLTRSSGQIPTAAAAADLASRKVGVQRGSRFEALLRSALVADGRMPAANLLVYTDIAKGVADTRAGSIDLMVLDRTQARSFLAEGDLRVAGEGLFDAPLTLALPTGSARLTAEIDAVLEAMRTDGAIQRLAEQALGLGVGDLLPFESLPSPVPGAPPAEACIDGMAWVEDLTYPDDGMAAPVVLQAGQPFVKTWRLRNIGACTWDTAYSLSYSRGSSPLSQMNGLPTSVAWQVQPGAEYDFSLSLIAPDAPGTYMGVWELRNQEGRPFGERLHVGINVKAAAVPTSTLALVPTAAPTPAPFSSPPVASISPAPLSAFGVDRITIERGECVYFTWNIQNIREVYFYLVGQPWEQHAATGQETREVCPARSSGYELRIVNLDNSVETRRLDVTVSTQPAPSISVWLSVEPSQAPVGACFTLSWRVAGLISGVSVMRDQSLLWVSAPQAGWLRDCPDAAGDVVYTVVATGMGQSFQAQRTVRVGP